MSRDTHETTGGMPPVMGFAAKSGTGKTTLMEAVIRVLTGSGVRVAALKHGHHVADPDTPGKDSHRFRAAGAATVLFTGPERWFMIQERSEELPIEAHLARLTGHDLILVEGYRDGPYPKILVQRQGAAELDKAVSGVVAWAGDDPALAPKGMPFLPLHDPEAVARFILSHLGLTPG